MNLYSELYRLGLSMREIAERLGIDRHSVKSEIDVLGGKRAFPNRPADKEAAFAATFKRYAELDYHGHMHLRELNAHEAWLCDILEGYLNLPQIIAGCTGMRSLIAQLLVPSYSRERAGHACLLALILDQPRLSADPMRKDVWIPDFTLAWFILLDRVACDGMPAPISIDHTIRMIASIGLEETRQKIMPIWDEMVFVQVDEMLATLRPRELDVICKRFGIGHTERWTLRQIGEQWYLKQDRIRQIEARALWKLRRQVHLRKLDMLAKPVGNAVQREFERRNEAAKAEEAHRAPQTSTLGPAVPINANPLCKKWTEIELTLRATNLLSVYLIVYVGDLVTKRERDLLKWRGFGHKTVKELKEVLAELGLSLGTRDDSPMVVAFRAWRDTQT